MKNQKGKTALLTTLILVIAAATIVHAAVTPRWSHISGIQSFLSISNETANIEVYCNAATQNVTAMKAKCELQQLDGSWTTIKTWTETENGTFIHYLKSYPVSNNYSYRLKITGYAYNGTTLLESATAYFD